MGIFDNVNSASDVQKDTDYVRGQRRAPMDSSIQNLIIRKCYVQKAKSGALGVVTTFEVADGEHKGREINITEYVTSGDKKGNKTFYEKPNDKGGVDKFNLPGFTAMNEMAHLTAGKGILECANEKRVVPVYSYEKKADVPTEVDMLTEVLGKGICGCVVHQIQDKTAQNTATGKYEPTGQTFATNVIDKFLRASDRKTYSEVDNGLDPTYKDQWLTKWEGKIDDQSSEVKNAGMKGAPEASGDGAPKADLFA